MKTTDRLSHEQGLALAKRWVADRRRWEQLLAEARRGHFGAAHGRRTPEGPATETPAKAA